MTDTVAVKTEDAPEREKFEKALYEQYEWAEEAINSSFFQGDDKTGHYYGCDYMYDGHSCAEPLYWAWKGWQARAARKGGE